MTTKRVDVTLVVNGKSQTLRVLPEQKLADVLHEELSLTGTKVCCGMGICKACTVSCKDEETGEMRKVQACITPAIAVDKMHITTIEGLAQGGELSLLQQAFLKHFAFQCGYCTSGFLMGATVLLDELKKKPIRKSEINTSIEKSIGDNVCRCTGYVKYYAAVREVILSTPGFVTVG